MKYFRVVITLNSGEILEKRTTNPAKYIESLNTKYPTQQEYKMLEILGLTSLVSGYIVASKVEPL